MSVESTQNPAVPQAQDKLAVDQAAAATPGQETKKPDDMSSKFAALAKKERMARMAQQKYKTMEAQIAEREKKIAERERMWEEEFKLSPLEAIKKRGYSYEDLTKAALNDGRFEPATEIKSVKEEINRLREEQAQKEQKALEAQELAAKQAEQEIVEGFKARIAETIEAQQEKYELTHLHDGSELVFQTIEEHFERTKAEGKPKVMSVEEACELVEQYFEAVVERMATKSKKFQTKYGTAKATDEQKGAGKSSVTLNNQMATSSAPSLLPTATENDRIKRALAALG
jgi:hypothetical protein